MTILNLSHCKIPVHRTNADRSAGLHVFLRYALTHQHASGWIAPLTLLIQTGGNVDG
jgi:hypothetical protein